MRLLKIGRDASCDIVLHSEKVSSLHAELTLLNSGDIMLEDKGSRNGTFIMNQQIKPNKPVNVRRGDAIRFADVELQWSQVPMPEDNSAYQGLYGIGSHFNNDFQISGSTVSRYHATIKHGRDGKMYIVDHSKNGTTVDGVKIPSNSPYRIKRKSTIVCGGVPVDISRLPWPSETWKYVLGVAASILVLVGVGFGVWKLIIKPPIYSDAELYARYESSIVMLIGKYHYEVTAGNLNPAILYEADIPAKFQWTGKQVIPEGDPSYGKYISFATGFFVSNEGHIVTNLHVTKPWLFDGVIDEIEIYLKDKFHQYAAQHDLEIMVYGGNKDMMLDAYTSQIKVTGKLDGLLFIPNGKFYSAENLVGCRVMQAGDDTNIDVSLVQSDRAETPRNCRYVNIVDSMDVNETALAVGNHMYTLGFPAGTDLQDLESEKGIQVLARGGSITHTSTEYRFGFDAASYHGASGSPIFNDRGMLIGVLNAGTETQAFNYGIKAKYVKEIMESIHRKQ